MKKITKILKKKFKNFNPKLKEECGVFGISDNQDASTLSTLGLHALQHRGQEGCGIVSFDGKKYHSEKRFGLVGDNFNKEKVLKSLPGNYAIGHNRYSTTGGTTLRNIQPFFADTNTGGIGVSHNGNLTNAITLRRKLVEDGAIFYTTSDTETIVQLIARSKRVKTIDKIVDALFQIQGGYSLVMLTQNTLIGVRDPFGIRPLVIGKLNNSYVFASETCALDIIGAKYIRDVENGEIVSVQDDKLVSIKPFPAKKVRPCVFEYIYFLFFYNYLLLNTYLNVSNSFIAQKNIPYYLWGPLTLFSPQGSSWLDILHLGLPQRIGNLEEFLVFHQHFFLQEPC